ncbi:MAG: DNA polymerase thumb domain-containing protein [Lachnospiraceae bacterium]
MDSLIFHIDVNSAFLSWEAVYRLQHLGETLDLRTIPSAVCGDIKKRHGIILAKSVPAKKYNIQTAETIGDALKKCPHLMLVRPHYDLYDTCSKGFMQILREYSPVVEQYSIDEAYIDMSGTESIWGSPVAAAILIRDQIYRELGFTVNIGISTNKLLAKMASDFSKPNRIHTLFPQEIKDKMWPLPVGNLFFCGRKTEVKLKNLDIHTIGDLACFDYEILKAHFKKHGEILYAFAHGMDVSLVEPIAPENKGYGNSMTVPFDVCDVFTARTVLLSLCESVGMRLRKDRKKALVISVSAKNFALSTNSHQMTLSAATNITDELYRCSCELFDELWDGYTLLRHIGVHTARIFDSEEARQLDLFTMDHYQKLEKLDSAIDTIRDRYGKEAVFRASYVGAKIRPINGGIGLEKKRVKGEDVYY